MEKIIFTMEDTKENVEFFIMEQTRVSGVDYLLVTDTEDEEEDGTCYILKDLSASEDAEALYEIVDDDEELAYVSRIFEELLEDVTIER
ncbi:DUF1292 domain-containing protein [Diplocloster agilis]|uniref:DUF1292 domain-containing protein n=1 Tax=Diplocloster agilis TaxID=2850323 RepID=A0A949NHJ4_9FIRM|nr:MULTISPECIES: DUF1292 domain-containing protein [Lachnospiraceae]MBU9738348.1 DUF1292 domain-containing protein [Diplocloster agilis]MBU9745814.1 DUF1292 domain-containing protein [Diplocloster agilis]MCU6734138.1 DUF1292 domain-containing protein [Suonthocola fibrivorans]SCJ24995.1 Protein of uncharacterised function (DUF1292) [uncultured Clostridium sp.]